MITVFALVSFFLLNSILPRLSAIHTFNGCSMNNTAWEEKLGVLECFSYKGEWRKSKNVYRTDKDKFHLSCNSNWNTDGICPNSTGRMYDYTTGHKCAKAKQYMSGARFCEMMNGRDIGFIGDSMTGEMTATFMNELQGLMGNTCHLCKPPCVDTYKLNCTQFATKLNKYSAKANIELKDFSVLDIRNDELIVDGVEPKFHYHTRSFHWVKKVESLNISVLVVNKGAHYENNDTLYIQTVNNTLSFIHENFPDISVIFRSTSRGHVNARSQFYSLPLKRPQKLTKESGYRNGTEYGWHRFQHQNLLVKQLIRAHYPNYIFMDIFDMTELRVDSHHDGLHYCIPGPIIAWVDLLFQLLDLFSLPTKYPHMKHFYK